jgi:hypothetical protein
MLRDMGKADESLVSLMSVLRMIRREMCRSGLDQEDRALPSGTVIACSSIRVLIVSAGVQLEPFFEYRAAWATRSYPRRLSGFCRIGAKHDGLDSMVRLLGCGMAHHRRSRHLAVALEADEETRGIRIRRARLGASFWRALP